MAEQIEGLRELNAALKELAPRKQINALRGAARASLKPVLKSARANAPVGKEPHKTFKGRLVAPGFLKRNINISTYKSRDGTRIGATVGTKAEAYYGRQFVELGTVNSAPSPWLRPAYSSNKSLVKRLYAQELRKQIIKQATKVRRRR